MRKPVAVTRPPTKFAIQFEEMCRKMMSCIKFFVSLSIVSSIGLCQEYIGFPEMVEDIMLLPLDNRTALSMPQVCGENEWYFPGNQKGVYVCDCIPGFLFVIEQEKCFEAYRRGPCVLGELLVLSSDKVTAICKRDNCAFNGMVTYKNECVSMGKPCDVDTRRRYGVNETTIEFECLKVSRFYQINRDSTNEPTKPPTRPTRPPIRQPSAPAATSNKQPSTPIRTDDRSSFPVQEPLSGDKIPVVKEDSSKLCVPGCKRYIDGKCPEKKEVASGWNFS